MVPLEVIAKEKISTYMCVNIILACAFGYSIFIVRPIHESERGRAVSVVHICVPFLSMYILEKIVLDFVLKRIDIICRL